jgi:hypothetical protein
MFDKEPVIFFKYYKPTDYNYDGNIDNNEHQGEVALRRRSPAKNRSINRRNPIKLLLSVKTCQSLLNKISTVVKMPGQRPASASLSR